MNTRWMVVTALMVVGILPLPQAASATDAAASTPAQPCVARSQMTGLGSAADGRLLPILDLRLDEATPNLTPIPTGPQDEVLLVDPGCYMHQVCAWGCDYNNTCEDLGCHPEFGARCLYDGGDGMGCCVIP